ncbi:ATP-grasp domain-containing protein [Massilia polaris]|uniref:ATP-grasp domain-containing protein n=1 Tax=Massilia polaris TaxID=2728846 RepID=UPI001E4DB7F9|nr:hypothetical protein [Massilia polaris]
MVVIDDSMSILRCTNKVYLADLMRLNKIPTPRTYALQRADVTDIGEIEREIGYPMVMKIPDGAFSRGVTKVTTAEEFQETAQTLLTQSALILVQEYMYTDFDWRIGVLNREAIFASNISCQKITGRSPSATPAARRSLARHAPSRWTKYQPTCWHTRSLPPT